jgi:hypothetical protein
MGDKDNSGEPLTLSGEAIGARYRYGRLLYAPMRFWQVSIAALAAVVPLAAGALIIWALFDTSAAHAVGFYFVIVGVEAAALWFATAPLYASRYGERRGEKLRTGLREVLDRAGAPQSPAMKELPPAGGGPFSAFTYMLGVELALTASQGFSVFALWPDNEPYLTEKEWGELSALVTRLRALRGLALTSTIAALAAIGVWADLRQYLVALGILAVALLLTAAGALARVNSAGSETLNRKSQLIARHGAEILAAYGFGAAEPADRRAELGKLSALIIDGASVLPSSPALGGAAGDALTPGDIASVQAAVKDVVRSPALVDFDGWLGIEVTDADGAPVSVTEDGEVPLLPRRRYHLVVAIATRRPSGLASPLLITGGIKGAVAEFSVLLDSRDPELRQPAQVLKVRTSGGDASARFTFEPREGVPPWLWVRVAQRQRVVQNVALVGIEAGSEG